MLGLPGGRRAVLVVGVGVVVVGVFPRQHGGAWRTAHGRGDKRIGKVCSTLFHDPPGLIHDLHGAWMRERVNSSYIIYYHIIILSYITQGDIKSALPIAVLQRELASTFSLPLHNTRHRQDKDISSFINSVCDIPAFKRKCIGCLQPGSSCDTSSVCVHECVMFRDTWYSLYSHKSHTI